MENTPILVDPEQEQKRVPILVGTGAKNLASFFFHIPPFCFDLGVGGSFFKILNLGDPDN